MRKGYAFIHHIVVTLLYIYICVVRNVAVQGPCLISFKWIFSTSALCTFELKFSAALLESQNQIFLGSGYV